MASLAAMLAAGCATSPSLASVPARDAAPRPNIVLILADDLGYGDIEPFGQQQIRTPNLQRMADEGLRFTQFDAGSTVCTPSRDVLLTGMHAGRIVADRNWYPNYPTRREAITFAELAKAAGYQTHYFGKWGLGGATLSPDAGGTDAQFIRWHAYGTPTFKGFDSTLAYLDQGSAHHYWPLHLWRDNVKELLSANQGVVPIPVAIPFPPTDRTTYVEDVFTSEVLDIIAGADGSQPFLVHMSYIIPHRETRFPAGNDFYAGESWPPVERAFASMVTYLDQNVGAIMDAVAANPAIAGNTLIFFTSDNGPQQTDGHSAAFFDGNGPLEGIKRDLNEGGIRVPTIAWWPGVTPAGATSDHVGHAADWLPTVADLAGSASPQGIDGVSFAPILAGATSAPSQPHLFFEFWEGPASWDRAAVRLGDWKYIRRGDGGEELYNLATDIGETTSLAASNPAKLAELRALADASGDGPPPVVPPVVSLAGDTTLVSVPATPPTRPATSAQTAGYWRFDNDGLTAGHVPYPPTSGPPQEIPLADEAGLNSALAVGRDTSKSSSPIHASDIAHRHMPGTGAPNAVSMLFDSSATQHISVPDAAHLDFGGATPLTIEAFVRLARVAGSPPANTDRQWLLQKKPVASAESALDYGLMLQLGDLATSPAVTRLGNVSSQTGREIALHFGDGAASWLVTSNFRIEDDAWHFVSASVDPAAGVARFVLDGAFEQFSFAPPGWAGANSGPLTIASHTNAAGAYNQPLEGTIDELRITRAIVPLADLLRPPTFTAEPTIHEVDFGTLTVGDEPVTRRFRLVNEASGYSNLVDAVVDASGASDARLSVSGGPFVGVTNGGPSIQEVAVTLAPSAAGSLDGQEIVVRPTLRGFGSPVASGPIIVRLAGTVEPPARLDEWRGGK